MPSCKGKRKVLGVLYKFFREEFSLPILKYIKQYAVPFKSVLSPAIFCCPELVTDFIALPSCKNNQTCFPV